MTARLEHKSISSDVECGDEQDLGFFRLHDHPQSRRLSTIVTNVHNANEEEAIPANQNHKYADSSSSTQSSIIYTIIIYG